MRFSWEPQHLFCGIIFVRTFFTYFPSRDSFFACEILAFKIIFEGFESLYICMYLYLYVYTLIYFGGSIYYIYLFREELARPRDDMKKVPAKKIPRRKILGPFFLSLK